MFGAVIQMTLTYVILTQGRKHLTLTLPKVVAKL